MRDEPTEIEPVSTARDIEAGRRTSKTNAKESAFVLCRDLVAHGDLLFYHWGIAIERDSQMSPALMGTVQGESTLLQESVCTTVQLCRVVDRRS